MIWKSYFWGQIQETSTEFMQIWCRWWSKKVITIHYMFISHNSDIYYFFVRFWYCLVNISELWCFIVIDFTLAILTFISSNSDFSPAMFWLISWHFDVLLLYLAILNCFGIVLHGGNKGIRIAGYKLRIVCICIISWQNRASVRNRRWPR